MLKRVCIALVVLVVGSVSVHAAPANVFRDGLCSVGWFGCPSDLAMIQPDGSWTCPAGQIGLVFIAGEWMNVETNNENGNEQARCEADIALGQPNPGGALGGGVEVVAVEMGTVCTFLPDACQGNGAFIANPRTVGSLAVCLIGAQPTTNMQEVVSPSGQASLVCALPEN